jgi:hypothetical protein
MEPLWSRWLQLVAIGRNSRGPETGEIKPKPLPSVATSCREERMVRRGSTVRVRQRASPKCLQTSGLACLGRKCLSHTVTVQDNGEPNQGIDTFAFHSDSYDVAGDVQNGNVQLHKQTLP